MTTTQLPMPVDDNVRSVKKSMAVPVPEHRGSGKKDLDMTSQDSSGFVKARKGVGSSARVSGRKGVEDNLATPEPEITTFSTPSISTTTTTTEVAGEKTTTEQPVVVTNSNEPAKNVNQVSEQSSRLLVHSGGGIDDHVEDLKNVGGGKPVKTVETVSSREEEESSSSLGSMVFGAILAVMLVSVVLFVGVKRLDAIRRRREYRCV